MRRGPKYVGLDVHQATTVASVRQANGQVIARTVLPTEEKALVEFFEGLAGAVHVAFEEGTQAQWLYDLLRARVARVVVADRRGQKRQGSHGDFKDADRLGEDLRTGHLRSVYHGSPERATLRELSRLYRSLVQDATRTMQRVKSLYRARAIRARGTGVYDAEQRGEWLAKLEERGARLRAEALLTELDLLRDLRPKAKAALVAEARKDPAWRILRTIPFMGPVRVALLLATMQTPWRFRTKHNLWAYAGLAVVTHSTAEWELHEGRAVRRQRPPMTRGLNRNHNHVLKSVFKGAAEAATVRPGPLQDFYRELLTRGLNPELARVTLTRKLAALTLRLWKTGETFDPTKLTLQAT
jgi:transposase